MLSLGLPAPMIALAFALGGVVAALFSAWYWYRSTKVEVAPLWLRLGQIEPLDMAQSQAHWTIGVLEAATASAAINRRAALWTGAAALFSALSALAGALLR